MKQEVLVTDIVGYSKMPTQLVPVEEMGIINSVISSYINLDVYRLSIVLF